MRFKSAICALVVWSSSSITVDVVGPSSESIDGSSFHSAMFKVLMKDWPMFHSSASCSC